MKKRVFLSVICFIFLSFFVGGTLYVSTIQKKKNQQITELKKEKESNYPEIYDVLDSITVVNFPTHINEKELVLYIGRPTCSDCNMFEPALIELIKEKNLEAKIYYLNISKLRDDEKKWEIFKEKYSIRYTPTLAKFTSGSLKSKVEWTPEYGISINQVEKWLDQNVL